MLGYYYYQGRSYQYARYARAYLCQSSEKKSNKLVKDYINLECFCQSKTMWQTNQSIVNKRLRYLSTKAIDDKPKKSSKKSATY